MRPALVIAHRGASGYEHENSLAAFRAAARRGADAVELDVHATTDGVLIVHHDESASGRHIARSSSHALADVRLPNGEPLPTLAQALDASGPGLLVFVEVKSLPARYDETLLTALDGRPDPARYAVHSFDHRIIRRLGDKRPTLRRGVLTSSYLLRPLAVLDDTGAVDLWQERSVVDAALVETMHGAGARVIVWTVNEEAEMRRLAALGVDGICTNYPDVARRVVDAREAR